MFDKFVGNEFEHRRRRRRGEGQDGRSNPPSPPISIGAYRRQKQPRTAAVIKKFADFQDRKQENLKACVGPTPAAPLQPMTASGQSSPDSSPHADFDTWPIIKLHHEPLFNGRIIRHKPAIKNL